jgi:DNA-directed RNA polymerase subunit M/transcription elongation factor TFIIS
MKFCVKCDNMYYLQYVENETTGDIQLRYECRQCHHVDETSETTSIMVLNDDAGESIGESSAITEYTKFDPTIPRLYNLPCPNKDCSSHASGVLPEILYVRDNHEKMSYTYMCCVCDHTWKHSM